MKIFYCRNCKEYRSLASANFKCTLECSAIIGDAGRVELYIEDVDTYIYGLKFEQPKFLQCGECQKDEVVILEVDECPHVWDVVGNERQCRLCKVRQKGKLIFGNPL